MALLRFSLTILSTAVLLGGCVAAGAHGEAVAAAKPVADAPYVSHLSDPHALALFHYARARMLLADGEHAGAALAYRAAIDQDPSNEGLRFELADLYLATEQPEQAARTVEDILLRNPDSLRANLLIANAYFGGRQPDKAVPYFRHALELDPDNEQVRLHLAIALMRMGEVDVASDELKELLRRNPDSVQGRLAMARLYRETGLKQRAVEEYLELLRRSPEMPQAAIELGLLYEELKEWQSALDVLAEVLRQRPLDFAVRHQLARVHVGMKQYDAALEQLQIIVDLKPEDLDARRKIGLIYLDMERWSDAVVVFTELLELKPDLDPVRYYLGIALERQSSWAPALEVFLAIGRDSVLYDDALAHIGYIYMETGRVGEAIDLLEARLAEGEPRPQTFNYLASLYMAGDQLDKALFTIEKGVGIYPDNVELLYQQGLLLERATRHDEAMRTMQALLAVDGEHAEALNFIAYALAVDNRDLDVALDYAERAAKLKPAPHILDTLGWVYYRKGRLLEALRIIGEVSRKMTNDAVIFEHLGDIHLALDNREEARRAYARGLELQPDNATLRDKLDRLTPP